MKSAQRQPSWWKLAQGVCFIILLFCVIVGPVGFFSTLNPGLQLNLLSAGTLKASLQVSIVGSDVGARRTDLYEADSAGQVPLTAQELTRFVTSNRDYTDKDVTVQNVSFPVSSDSFWLISPALRQQLASMLNSTGASAFVVLSYSCRTNGSTYSYEPPAVQLSEDQIVELTSVLNDTTFEGKASIQLAGAFNGLLHLGAATSLYSVGAASQVVNLTLQNSDTGKKASGTGLPFWSLSKIREEDGSIIDDSRTCNGCPLTFQVISDKSAPYLTPDSGGSSFTVIGVYLGVVYTIGSFLRMAYKDSSKRIVYEELPDTDLLLDLCNGIYIARIQGDLQKEYDLYYTLIAIYRSPEMLYNVSILKRAGLLEREGSNMSASERGSETSTSLRRRSALF